MSRQLSSIKKIFIYTKRLIEILCNYGNNHHLQGQNENECIMKNQYNASYRYKKHRFIKSVLQNHIKYCYRNPILIY